VRFWEAELYRLKGELLLQQHSDNQAGLLLDSRVVDMLMASIPNFVILSSFKPLFFKGLRKALCFSDNAGA
jgi:hypothetical protein